MAVMTLTQLRAFVTVARLGSVKAAAVSLGVTEAAVSGAVAALRRELGDLLFIRASGGISLTPGGRRLAAGAAEIVGLAEETRHRVRQASSSTAHLRVASTEAGCRAGAPRAARGVRAAPARPGRRHPRRAGRGLRRPAPRPPGRCHDRSGPAPGTGHRVDTVPALPAGGRGGTGSPAATPPAADTRPTRPRTMVTRAWPGLDPDTLSGTFLSHIGVEAKKAKAFPSVTASLNAVAAWGGAVPRLPARGARRTAARVAGVARCLRRPARRHAVRQRARRMNGDRRPPPRSAGSSRRRPRRRRC